MRNDEGSAKAGIVMEHNLKGGLGRGRNCVRQDSGARMWNAGEESRWCLKFIWFDFWVNNVSIQENKGCRRSRFLGGGLGKVCLSFSIQFKLFVGDQRRDEIPSRQLDKWVWS